MPEVLRVRGYRFFFFSREGHEPRHVHVEQAERYAKILARPNRASGGARIPQLRTARALLHH